MGSKIDGIIEILGTIHLDLKNNSNSAMILINLNALNILIRWEVKYNETSPHFEDFKWFMDFLGGIHSSKVKLDDVLVMSDLATHVDALVET
ncbi:MAG: hypothetical protein HRU03_09120, partial [Nanoarchaeales archaeon]|nr:hypothetical protein [Nanoarchaeales archaeon]